MDLSGLFGLIWVEGDVQGRNMSFECLVSRGQKVQNFGVQKFGTWLHKFHSISHEMCHLGLRFLMCENIYIVIRCVKIRVCNFRFCKSIQMVIWERVGFICV